MNTTITNTKNIRPVYYFLILLSLASLLAIPFLSSESDLGFTIDEIMLVSFWGFIALVIGVILLYSNKKLLALFFILLSITIGLALILIGIIL